MITKKYMRVLKCPVCKSEEITLYMGAQFGKYMCKKCKYIGPLILDEGRKKGNKVNRKDA